MLAISLVTAACSSCLYVLAVLYRARGASRSAALTFLVFGAFAAVMLARILS
jgi:NADH:ubiquinone oxidoreductase subunit 2 (subunit N)